MKSQLPVPGDTYRGFRVTKVQTIGELQCQLMELIHEGTGAAIMHLANEDPENLFCLSFQTRPSSSNGVAHILEHTVLCGSDKFPLKDPFFAMTRRSLNTFMNALTGADFTCYPAASQISKDFYNLLNVYLDAVFRPRILELSFKQEGHRLEFSNSQDPKSPLEYKGIVFNEMKGALSSAMSRLSERIGEELFPDITYGYNSGGDPKVIPQLTYEQLKAFHHKYYHPSRCLFFFYGNMPLQGHLDFIAEQTLERSDRLPALEPLPRQPRFSKPKRVAHSYPAALDQEGDEKCYVALAWLTCHILEQEELLALGVLDTVLMDNDASPLRMAILKSGLCKNVSSSLEGEMSEIPWVMFMRGCQEGDADKLEKVVRDTLEEIAQAGIPKRLVESAMHQLELQRTEITGDSAPYGLSLFWRSALLKQHGGNPEDGLLIHSLFSQLRDRISKDPAYLSSLIRKYTLQNNHCVRVVMVPDKTLAAQEDADERSRLDAINARLSKQQRDELIHQAEELARFQHEQEDQDLSVLPKLTLLDVPKKAREYPLKRETLGALEVFHHGCFTNQIVYADMTIDLARFTAEELPLVRLLTRLLSEMGSGGRDYRATLEFMQEHTGGVDANLHINRQAGDVQAFTPLLQMRGKALYRNGEYLFGLMRDIATSVDLTDRERLKEIVLKHYTSLEGSFNSNAMRYAVGLSASALDPAERLGSLWHGLEYYWTIRDLAQHFDERVPKLLAKLEDLRERLLHLDGVHLVLSCDDDYYQHLRDASFYGLAQLPGHRYSVWQNGLHPLTVPPQGRIIASPVAFTAKVFPTVGYSHADAGPLGLAAHIMENQTLHTRIREKGGAYGGGAVNSPMHAHFYFYAYRDPHIVATLEAFEAAVHAILAGEFDEEDLEEAKLEIVQELDAPVAPSSRASLAYGWLRAGKTYQMRQRNRDRILAATKDDVMRAVRTHVVPNMSQGRVVVFSGRELLEKENEALKQRGQPVLAIEKV